jgi:hypothetical protein
MPRLSSLRKTPIDQGYQNLEQNQEALLGGMKEGGEKDHEHEQNIKSPPRAR